MRTALLILLFGASLGAQSLSFRIGDVGTGGAAVLPVLPSNYQFPDTPVGSSSPIVIQIFNGSSSAVSFGNAFVRSTPDIASAVSPDFTVTGLAVGGIIAPGSSRPFTLTFAALSQGARIGYLKAQVNDTVIDVATLQGTATQPQLTLSCSGPPQQCDGSILQPVSPTPLLFGNVPTTTTASVIFTLTNNTSGALPTAVSLVTQQFANTPFSLDASSLPGTLAAHSSAQFTVVFAPGTASTFPATLKVGSNTYGLQGSGLADVGGNISSLVVQYVDVAGVRQTAQGTPIDFGQIVAGTGTGTTMTFTISNPTTTINSVSASLTLSGTGFSSSDMPASVNIASGQSVSFHVGFSGSATGTYTGTLSLGTRQFTLQAQAIAPLVPSVTFSVDQQPLTSQHQAHLSIQTSSAPSAALVGTLTMQFSSSVANVSDDPAINFVAISGRQLSVTVPAGSQTATYNSQSAITFQTGTTAGNITFTLQFPNSPAFTQSYTITPAQVQITSISAVRQAPNLIVTLTGYDNTYSAGQLSFTFTGTNGQNLTPGGIQVNASSDFHQYFFTNNKAGGAFSLQASFPVTGEVTQVGSVAVNLTNSSGQASTNQSFQ